MRDSTKAPEGRSTHGFEEDSLVFRIEWSFNSYTTVPILGFAERLASDGFDVDEHFRLRTPYALQLQQSFASHVFRVGSPVTPPVRIKLRARVVQIHRPRVPGSPVKSRTFYSFDDDELSASYFQDSIGLRITPAIADRLRAALEDLRSDMQGHVESLESVERDNLESKLEAVNRVLSNDQKWLDLLQYRDLLADGKREKLVSLVYLAVGDYQTPAYPAVVLHVEHHRS